MQKRNSILALLGIGTAIPVLTSFHKEADRPNIIFIMSDDHAYQAISAYGGSLA